MKRVAMLFGGCGGRVAEALAFAACAGVISAGDMRLMFVDPDTEDAHTARALSLLKDYARVRSLYEGSPSQGEFAARFIVSRWPDHLPGNATALREWLREDTDDELLMRALFTPQTAQRDMRHGFRGDQALASAVMAGLLAESDSDADDALRRLIQELEGEDAQIVLVGSLSGGTGGAGLPAMAAHLKERLGERAHLSAILLLPYGAQDQAADAKAALRRCVAEGLDMPLCLLGLPEGARVTELSDAARLNEWLAVHALDWLLRHDASDHAMYTYRAASDGLTWELFGREAALYRDRYIRLMKTSALFRLALTDDLMERLSRPASLRDRLSGWYAACFRGSLKASDEERQELLQDLNALTRLLDGAWAWMEQLIATLPPQLRYAGELAEAFEAARAGELALAELAGQLDVMTREAEESGLAHETVVHRSGSAEENEIEQAQHRLAAMDKRLRELTEAQKTLNRRLGGRESIEMLSGVLLQCRNEAEAVRRQEKEARRRIDQAEAIAAPQDQHRILTARTKLKPMQRHLAMQDARIARVQRDIELAKTDESSWQGPVISEQATTMPGLFSTEAMRRLRPASKGGSRKAQKQWTQEATAAFPALAVLPQPDGMTMKRVLQALGKARPEGEHPLACLLSRTMALVLEEDA